MGAAGPIEVTAAAMASKLMIPSTPPPPRKPSAAAAPGKEGGLIVVVLDHAALRTTGRARECALIGATAKQSAAHNVARTTYAKSLEDTIVAVKKVT